MSHANLLFHRPIHLPRPPTLPPLSRQGAGAGLPGVLVIGLALAFQGLVWLAIGLGIGWWVWN